MDTEPPSMDLPAFSPHPALVMEDTGLPRGLVFDLVLKHAFLDSSTTLAQLMAATKLDYGVVHAAYRYMQKDQLCETRGVVGNDPEFSLTAKGSRRAEEAYRKNPYVGPAPVPLASYCEAVRRQAFRPQVTAPSLAENLSDLVLPESTIRDLGAAIMTGGSVFLYGPTGNGKTSIAERMHRIFHDLVYIPAAVEVSNQILTLYDPNVHRPWPQQPADIDPRWVLCYRPSLLVGGELQPAMLEPRVDGLSGLAVAPIQMKANNGVLVIDDFGRQQIAPRELLNRWIMPLDRGVDYLSLGAAGKFEIPFEVVVVFATNLNPNGLAEEAFLRRIKNKVKIGAITPETFSEIWQRECQARGIAFVPEIAEYACRRCAEAVDGELRACFPRDLMDIIGGVAALDQRPVALSQEEVDHAAKLYFIT
jgi:predicted ATPase with chaperone activity